MECYPPLFSEDGNFSSMSVINITDQLTLVDQSPLDLHGLSANAEQAAAAFIAASTASNTVRSYRSALTYWSAWLQLRYDLPLGNGPLRATVAVQFVLDHLARPLADGSWAHLLPPAIDATLVAARIKAKPGALTSVTAWPCWGYGIGSTSGTVQLKRLR